MTAADMVDWELAISVASRLAGPGPEVSRSEADAVVAELREDAARSTGLVREYTGLVAADADRARSSSSTGRAGSAPTPTSFDLLLTPFVDKVTAKKGPPSGVHQGPGVAGHGGRDRCRAGLPRRQGARAVRPVPRAVGPAAARRAQHRPRRARARRRPAPTSGSGSACTRRPTACSSPRCRGCATTSTSRSAGCPSHRADPAPRRRPQGSLRGAQGRVQGRACSTSSARPSSARSWTTSPA